MIRESVEEEITSLNEEELDELLGGLKGLVGGAGAGLKRAGQAVAGRATQAADTVKGAATQAAGAIKGAASQAAGAVKGAYQAGEKQAALNAVKKGIAGVITTIDQAIQKTGDDPNAQHDLENVKAAISTAQQALAESKKRQSRK
jgi:hypothetical protein